RKKAEGYTSLRPFPHPVSCEECVIGAAPMAAEAAVHLHHHGLPCAPASVPAARQTLSSDHPSAARGSCPATPCGCPSSSPACPARQQRCPRAMPSSASWRQHRLPSPESPGPVSG